mmetsp:Transcript_24419/g.44809  ORF Transcript_24419/g.44809 Transcript_24419/m.44809 type:complete len:343 (+) Transcript_24419:81-1109(+)
MEENVTSLTAAQESVPAAAAAVATAGPLLWLCFSLAMCAALAADLIWGARPSAKESHLRTAIVSSAWWLGLGFAFALFLAIVKGGEVGLVFLTGYLVEKSLSVDNLVVIALVFRSFRIKTELQGPVLKWGIIGAVVFRTIFIFAGVAILEVFHGAIYIFGGLLLWSAYKMFIEEDDDNDDMAVEAHKKGNSWMMRCLTSVMPYRPEARSTRFFENVDGRLVATPLFASLVVVELSDLLFAVDSIPCILGLTQDLFLVFSSNMLAILGLRSLYLLLAEALEHVRNLKKGLAAVLAFVGAKMMLGNYFPISQHMSLLVIFGILGVTFATSSMGQPPKLASILPL